MSNDSECVCVTAAANAEKRTSTLETDARRVAVIFANDGVTRYYYVLRYDNSDEQS